MSPVGAALGFRAPFEGLATIEPMGLLGLWSYNAQLLNPDVLQNGQILALGVPRERHML